MSRFNRLCALLGYRFRQEGLLEEALTHPSLLASQKGKALGFGYERLEFLGDRVLGLAVAAMLYRNFPEENEGALAKRHAALVRRESLARIALLLGLDREIALSRGEKDGGGSRNPTILADACEAVLGAIYADGGKEEADALIVRLWAPLMAEETAPPKDPKSALQEWAQGRGRNLPIYKVTRREGPEHQPTFFVVVEIEGFAEVSGTGTSRRAAEQDAARYFLEKHA